MKLKKLTQRDRYGNTMSYEFEGDTKQLDPTRLMEKQMEMMNDFEVPEMMEVPAYDHPGEPRGSDTVPAWLTPGEFVVNAEAMRIPGAKEQVEHINNMGREVQRAQGGSIGHENINMGSFDPYFADGGQINSADVLAKLQAQGMIQGVPEYGPMAGNTGLDESGFQEVGSFTKSLGRLKKPKKDDIGKPYWMSDREWQHWKTQQPDWLDANRPGWREKQQQQLRGFGGGGGSSYEPEPERRWSDELGEYVSVDADGVVIRDNMPGWSSDWDHGDIGSSRYANGGSVLKGAKDVWKQGIDPRAAMPMMLPEVPMDPLTTREHRFAGFDSLGDMLGEREGYSDSIYLDSLGKPTIGYGRLVEDAVWDANDPRIGTKPYSAEQLEAFKKKDMETAMKDAKSNVGAETWDKLTENQKWALTSQAFQLGKGKQAAFENQIKAIQAGDYDEAARQAYDSAWYGQTPKRTHDLAFAFSPQVASQFGEAQYRAPGGGISLAGGNPLDSTVYNEMTPEEIEAELLRRQADPNSVFHPTPNQPGTFGENLRGAWDKTVADVAGLFGGDEPPPAPEVERTTPLIIDRGDGTFKVVSQSGETIYDKATPEEVETYREAADLAAPETVFGTGEFGVPMEDRFDREVPAEEAVPELVDPTLSPGKRDQGLPSALAMEQAREERADMREADWQRTRERIAEDLPAIHNYTQNDLDRMTDQVMAEEEAASQAAIEEAAAVKTSDEIRNELAKQVPPVAEPEKPAEEPVATPEPSAPTAPSGQPTADVEAAGQELANDPENAPFLQRLMDDLKSEVKDTFSTENLSHLAIRAAGAMAFGTPPMQAIQWAAGSALKEHAAREKTEAQTEATRRQQAATLLGNKIITAESADKFIKSGKFSDLETSAGTKVTKTKLAGKDAFVPGVGRVEVFDIGGTHMIKTGPGANDWTPIANVPGVNVFDADTMSSKAITAEFDDAIKSYVNDLNQGVEEKAAFRVDNRRIADQANRTFQKYLKQSNLPVENTDELKYQMNEAMRSYVDDIKKYDDAVAADPDQTDVVKPSSFEAYFENRLITKKAQLQPSLFNTTDGQPMDAKIQRKLNKELITEGKGNPDHAVNVYRVAQAAWAGATEAQKQRYMTPPKGYSPFAYFVQSLARDDKQAEALAKEFAVTK